MLSTFRGTNAQELPLSKNFHLYDCSVIKYISVKRKILIHKSSLSYCNNIDLIHNM